MKSWVNPAIGNLWIEVRPALEKGWSAFEKVHGISSPTLAELDLALFNLNPCLYVSYVGGPTPAQEYGAAHDILVNCIRGHMKRWGRTVSFSAIEESLDAHLVPNQKALSSE